MTDNKKISELESDNNYNLIDENIKSMFIYIGKTHVCDEIQIIDENPKIWESYKENIKQYNIPYKAFLNTNACLD